MDQNITLSPNLRTKLLIEHRDIKIRLFGAGLFLIPLACTIIGIVFIPPIVMIIQKISASIAARKLEDSAQVLFPAFIGRVPKYIDLKTCGYGAVLTQISATGIAYADGRLYILEEGTAAEIPWADIRSWSSNVNGYTTTELYGSTNPAVNLQVAQTNQTARVLAHRGSGITISTFDIDKPEWRFQTSDRKLISKWLEILSQMKEGRLPRA